MSKRDTRTPEQQDEDDRIRRAEQRQERLDETLTRREVLDALESAAVYFPERDPIAFVLRKLAEALS